MTTADPKRIAVVGAGLGGLAAAIGLQRSGHDVTVFDKGASFEELHVGGGMQLGVNAMRAFREIGLEEVVAGAGTAVLKQQLRAPSGALLGDWPVVKLGERFGVTDVRLMRSDLHRALAEALGSDSVRFGQRTTGFSQDDEAVRVQFDDGTEFAADVLVGADGLHSAIRPQIVETGEPRYAGYAYWRGRTDKPHPMVKQGESQLFIGTGVRFAYYAVGDDHVTWWSVTQAPQGPKDVSKAELLERHRGWAAPIEELLEATDPETIDIVDIVDRDPVERWGEGRVTLLGDAAHPMTIDAAQGACQAIEDAVVLTRCLERQDAVAGLREYERLRIPRTTAVVLQARRMGNLVSSDNKVKTAMRNGFMRLGGWRLLWKNQEKVLAHDFLEQ